MAVYVKFAEKEKRERERKPEVRALLRVSSSREENALKGLLVLMLSEHFKLCVCTQMEFREIERKSSQGRGGAELDQR